MNEQDQQAEVRSNEGFGGKPSAWHWKHLLAETGEVVAEDVSLTRVDPTDNAFWMAPDDPRRVKTVVVELFAAPQPAERVPLTDEYIDDLAEPFISELGGHHWYSGESGIRDHIEYARAIERKCAEAWGVKLEGQG